jgi:nucleoside phosphorylase/tetratricopeptide (TPR) repeat protein
MTQHTISKAKYCAVIVTALPVEYRAVRAHLAEISEDEHPEGDVYELGLFDAGERLWEVGIVEMGMGNPNAAQKTERAIAHFHPEVVLFVGVAGGIKDVTIGDVVVATKVYGYHAGKAADEFKTRPAVGLPQYRILERARAESRKSDWLKSLDPAPSPVPRVFLGAIAAGEQVLTSTQSESYKLIRDAYNDALAVEMESYGFLIAAQAHSGLESLAVRGISDLLAGKAKADKSGSQERASRHAAAFAFEVLAKLILPDKTIRKEIREVIREVSAAGSALDRTVIDQTVTASGGSVMVQNSPFTQVMTTSTGDVASIPPDQTGKLIDAIQQQANVMRQQASAIGRLISQRDAPFNMKYSSPATQGGEIGYVPIEGQTWGNEFPVTQMPREKTDGVSGEASAKSRERAALTDIAEIIEKLETADDIVAEIRSQLAVWNSDAAFLLAGRLEEHLKGIEDSTCPRLLEYLFLMARVHVIRAEKRAPEPPAHIEQANGFLARIDAHLAASPRPALAADVNALRGSIENIQNGPEAALRFLADRNDPYAIRIRLAIYLNKQDVDGAVGLIEGKPPHLRWCDLGVMAYAAASRRMDALALVDWASEQDDRSKYPQCVVRLAESSLVRVLANQEPGKNILPQDLNETEQVAMQQVLKDLDPVLTTFITGGSVDSELATVAVRIGWQAHHLLGHRDEVATLARLMSTRTPVPTEVARSVMSGYLTPPPDLPERLREDHPDDLDANILATVVELHMGQHTKAYEEAKKLFPLADTNKKKEELFMLFQQLWHELDGDALTECERIALPLVDHHPQLQAMFDAARALRAGNGAAALEALDKQKAEDDLYWLQLRGNALMQQGYLAEAVEMFQLVARQTGAPILLHKTAELAFQTEKVAVAVECYEALIAVQPDNLIARGNLASLYTFHLNDIGKAAIQFQALHEAEPGNPVHTVNLAICLSQLYRPKESLALYDEACNTDLPDLRAVLGRAELHLSLGDPDAACASLQQFRDAFWDSPDFLLACMNIAYAAGNEELAYEALTKLNELRAAGIVDENAFRMVQTDEALEIFKETFKAAEDRKKLIHTEMLKGRMPWMWAAQLSADAVYWAWRLRTLELRWVGDDPINRASYTIYSTNGFHVGEMEDGRRALLPLECPPPGTPVVADLSALITLHRLGLLDKTADYFGAILIPQTYLATVLEDGKKLIIHQRSRQRTAEEINRHVDAGTIATIDQKNGRKEPLPVADEYHDTDVHRYHLIDLMKPVYEAGLMNDAAYERVNKVCSKPSSVDGEHPPLARLQDVHIELLTLETLTSFGLLNEITKYYRVYIASEARIELRQRLDALRFQEETRIWHFDLWDQIRDDNRFRFVQALVPQEMRDKRGDDKDFLALLASFIAQDQGVPLLADERVCQALTLNERQGTPHAAFGSDAVVLALFDSGRLDASGAAEAMRSLMRWRYRFIIPSATILKTYAAQYRGNPPGLPLREVAEYIHDCMRDTGLFGGPENTDLKDSMAMRLYLSWLDLFAEWLVGLWGDSEFTDNTATQLTEWCVQEALPSQPRVVHGSVKVRIGSLTGRLLISKMLLDSISVADDERVSAAMKATQSAFKLSDEDYLRIVTETLNETRRTESNS